MNRPFVRYTWATLAYNIAVILWGAYVRVSHSGDGCGTHWPLCHGQVIPISPAFATLTEFIHRITSGIALCGVIILLIWAYRAYERGHLARYGAVSVMVFMLSEALLGAALVLFSLVASNTSVTRALFMAAHLINTFLLLASITLTGWWAAGGGRLSIRKQGRVGWMLLFGLLGMILVGSSGAMSALGDTLFPAVSLAHGLAQDFDPTSHFTLRLRILHPLVAFSLGLYLVLTANTIARLRPSPLTKRLAQILVALFLLQGSVGALNLALVTPLATQIIHLFMADLVWVAMVLLSAAALSQPVPETVPQIIVEPTSRLTEPVERGTLANG